MKPGRVVTFLILVLMLGGTLFPLIWMFYSSLLERGISLVNVSDLFQQNFTLRNYKEVFTQAPFGRFFSNSMVVALIVTLGNLLLCSMAGYAFARKNFPLKESLFFTVILVLMVPAHILIIPLYILINRLGWYGT
jgi:multiple sugar transport system permease protein